MVAAGPYRFFTKQEDGQTHPVVFVQTEAAGVPGVLLNPNDWSEDGTLALGQFMPSPSGRYVLYGTRRGGASWQEYRVLEVATRRLLPDRLPWIIGYYTAWHGETGFFYARPFEPPPQGAELTTPREHHAVFYHRLGTDQQSDRLVHREPAHPRRHFSFLVSTDGQTEVLLSSAPEGGGEAYRDVRVRAVGSNAPWMTVIANASARFDVIDVTGEIMLARTNIAAPRGRVVRIALRRPAEADWSTIIPENDDVLQAVTSAGGRLFARYLRDVTTRVRVHRIDGTISMRWSYQAKDWPSALRANEPTMSCITATLRLIRQRPCTLTTSRSVRAPYLPSLRCQGKTPSLYETRQVFYSAKDGTRIPMFLVHKKNLVFDGRNPTLLHAYGAFGVSSWPDSTPRG